MDVYRDKKARMLSGAPLRLLDICGGAGGFSLGFKSAGFELVGCVEKDAKAATTYAANFHANSSERVSTPFAKPRDLQKCSAQQLASEFGYKSVDSAVDIIVAGLPCQAYSRVGRAKLAHLAGNATAHEIDPRARLYYQLLVYVRELRPLCLVLENVPDIVNHGSKNIAEEICMELEILGYDCRYSFLNAANYGVPQFRERLFLIAYHSVVGRAPSFPAPTHCDALPIGYKTVQSALLRRPETERRHFQAVGTASGEPPFVSAYAAIGDLPKICRKAWKPGQERPSTALDESVAYRGGDCSRYAVAMKNWVGFEARATVNAHVSRHNPRDYPLFAEMLPGDQYPQMHSKALRRFEKEVERRKANGEKLRKNSLLWRQLKDSIVPPYDPNKFPNKWWKLVPDRPSRTLTAHLGKDSYSHIHYDSDQARTISVREAARLQSFPDGFVFTGGIGDAFKQIGNAVPPLLSRALATRVACEMRGNNLQISKVFEAAE